MNVPKAIIVGCGGQDGGLLFDLLAAKGYALLGIARTGLRVHRYTWTTHVDIGSYDDVCQAVQHFLPDEIYYLAAYHHASEDRIYSDNDLFHRSFAVHLHSLVNFLDAVRLHAPAARLFYAASSHVFGQPESEYQDELTPINPTCVYGISKAAGIYACRYYRNVHAVFASVGILYNHESPLRDKRFISQKIIQGAINIKNGTQDKLVIGNMQSVVDWGYAQDYVEAMHKVLSYKHADDFIVATGVKHTVQEFVETTFSLLGIDWQKYVVTDPSLLKKKSKTLIGNPRKLHKATGWRAMTGFREMISLMLNAQLAACYTEK